VVERMPRHGGGTGISPHLVEKPTNKAMSIRDQSFDGGNRTTDRRHLHLVQWRDESKLRVSNLYPNNYFNESIINFYVLQSEVVG
jgi:hypothetical protein